MLVSNSQGGTFFTAEIVAAVNIAAGALIALVAGQDPTVNTGDKVNVITPVGEPNKTIVV